MGIWWYLVGDFAVRDHPFVDDLDDSPWGKGGNFQCVCAKTDCWTWMPGVYCLLKNHGGYDNTSIQMHCNFGSTNLSLEHLFCIPYYTSVVFFSGVG